MFSKQRGILYFGSISTRLNGKNPNITYSFNWLEMKGVVKRKFLRSKNFGLAGLVVARNIQ